MQMKQDFTIENTLSRLSHNHKATVDALTQKINTMASERRQAFNAGLDLSSWLRVKKIPR